MKQKIQKILIPLVLLGILAIITVTMTKGWTAVETYKDPLWMQRSKLYADYYPRANGSIYGTPKQGWNMFSGLNSNTRAY